MRDTRKRDAERASTAGRAQRARDLGASAGHELGRAFRRLNREVSAALRAEGLSAIQGSILIALWSKGPAAVGELQRAMGLSSSAFSGALDRMERAGLVRRVPAPDDRRSSLVEAVGWERSRRRAVIEALLDAEDSFLAPLDARERRSLLALLRKLAAGRQA